MKTAIEQNIEDLRKENQRLQSELNKLRTSQQEELLQQNAQMEATTNSIPNGYFLYNNENTMIFMNENAEKILGLTEEDKKLSLSDRMQLFNMKTSDGKSLPVEQAPLIRAQKGEIVQGELLKVSYNGKSIWLSVSAAPIVSTDGIKYGAVVEFSDVTKIKKAELEVKENEIQLRQMADSMPQLIWITRPDGYHEYFNKRWYEFTGTKPGETYGDVWSTLLHPDDYQRSLNLWHHSLKTGQPYSIEYRFKRGSDNTYHWFLGRAMPVHNKKGEITHWFGTCTNIQDLKETEQALMESQERYRLVNKATHDIIWDWDLQTDSLTWNEAVESVVGKARNELTPSIESWHEHIHPEDRESALESIHQAIQSGKAEWNCKYRFGPKGGPWRSFYDRGFIAYNEKGKAFRMIGSMLDLTERREAENALEKSQKLLHNVLEVLPVGVFVADEQGKIALTNTAAEKLWGGAKHIAINNLKEYRGWWRKTGKRLDSEDWAISRAYIKGESSDNEEIDIECFDGTRKTILNFASPVRNDDGRIISAVAVSMDITSRIETEESLRKSEERFRTLADNISQLAWMADENGKIFWYNNRWYDYTGTTPEEVQGYGWEKVHHPDHIERVLKSIQNSLDNIVRWEDTFPLKGKDGQYRWFLTRAIPIKDQQGNLIKWFGTNTDITEQRESQIQLKNARDLLENILYILAHDLKGPIGNMHMARNLIHTVNDMDKKVMMLDMYKPMLERMENTIKGVTDILQVQKTEGGSAVIIDLESLMNDIFTEFKNELKSEELNYNFSNKRTIKYIEPFLLSILRNLINNALKYRRDDIPIKIELESEKTDDYVLISVKDNGIGIDLDKNKDKLFIPFSRITSKKTEGTGIGLYIIKTIIEKNGGYIDVESTPGEGTTFFCYLKEYGDN